MVLHSIKLWLRLFRSQTWPATMLLIMTPFLHNHMMIDWKTYAMFLSTLLFHHLMFGQNSLLDTTQGYDKIDPNKQGHPLVSGEISFTAGHNVIHWGLAFATTWAAYLTLTVSPNPSLAMFFLLMWVVFGWGYNLGLSKESLWGWVALDVGYTGMGAWAWLMSHSTIDRTGGLYLCYAWLTLMFQISWEGFLKDMELDERSNLIKVLGGRLRPVYCKESSTEPNYTLFEPGHWGGFYAIAVKVINLIVPSLLIRRYTLLNTAWYYGMCSVALFLAWLLIAPRIYVRSRELLNMSMMEVVTIYLIVPIILPWSTAIPLMVLGVAYFFGINLILWGKPYPRV